MEDGIVIKGAREHNLKNIDVFIPRNKITVITGISGSGKSTLAFDTIYAEGQRRYVEGLSTYARQFLDQIKKPDVDSIQGLSPAISIEQKTTVSSPRSTVGTTTEIYDLIRLMFSRVGVAHCPDHQMPLAALSEEQILNEILALPENSKIHILAPVVRNKKGSFLKEIERWQKKGFLKAKIDDEYVDLDKAEKIVKNKTHNIELLIDRLIVKPEIRARLKESILLAIKMSDGFLTLENLTTKSVRTFSKQASCPVCKYSPPEIEPRLFSYNDPRGYCTTCTGLGYIDHENPEPSIIDRSPDDEHDEFEEFDEHEVCPSCHGSRLRKEALSIFVKTLSISEFANKSIKDLKIWFEKVKWTDRELQILEKLLFRLNYRVNFLLRLGLGHLSLARGTRTLSGGEAQRIRLANQLGSPLVGVLYVLDEPSIGLHPKDNDALIQSLRELQNQGNTVLIVEHDEETILSADYVIDIGPRAGVLGGEIVDEGTPDHIVQSKKNLTGLYLSHQNVAYVIPQKKNLVNFLTVEGATGNNLKDISLNLPLNALTAVTGVSGSGKSSLIIDTIYKHLANQFYKRNYHPCAFKKMSGQEKLSGIIEINQRPIGRTPRSNPATYVGLFSLVRSLFANLPESRLRGYKPGRFSFNVKGGRCEACQGGGQIKIEMHFMADVFVMCDVCQGKRYNRETLAVTFKGKSISDVLDMSIEEALGFFENHDLIYRKLEILHQVGLDYIKLGQSSTTLSGGESQRVKLSKELSKRHAGSILYILDEPTTGLHFEDTKKLVELLHRLVDQGNTVICIEHNLDIIASSDYVIDLGPGSGDTGGSVVFTGTPTDLCKSNKSWTGQYLKKHLNMKRS